MQKLLRLRHSSYRRPKQELRLLHLSVIMKFLVVFLSITITRSYTLPIGSISSSGSLHSTAVLTPLENLGGSVDNAVSTFARSKAFSVVTPFPDSGRKVAILEQKSLESLPIKLDDKYGNIQTFVADIVNPQPLVDTIKEHEKYGNDGEHFRQIANKVVGGVEGLSNVLNTAAELPFTALKHVSQTITTSFNTVGGKLVGLSQ